jgi:serine/threonine protein kinase
MRNEIDIMRNVSHPNIVRLLKVCESPTAVYLVMEFAEGGSLADLLKQNIRLTEPVVKGLTY